MHLLDIPKPKRSPHGRYMVAASLLFAACAATPLLCRPRPRPVVFPCILIHPKEHSPIKYVTVRRAIIFRGDSITIEPYQKSLIELHKELREMQDKAIRTLVLCSFSPVDAQKKALLRAEKDFAKKYGLTPEQIKQIKWDWYGLKKETDKQP